MRGEALTICRLSVEIFLSIATPAQSMKVTAEKSSTTVCSFRKHVRHSFSSRATQSQTIRPSSLSLTSRLPSVSVVIRSTEFPHLPTAVPYGKLRTKRAPATQSAPKWLKE